VSTDISEAGLEATIVAQMTAPEVGWVEGDPGDYDREFALDLVQLAIFLEATQPEVAEAVEIRDDGTTHGSRARSPRAASSTCCEMASSTGR
jgi:type I restriction enzyme R subunit